MSIKRYLGRRSQAGQSQYVEYSNACTHWCLHSIPLRVWDPMYINGTTRSYW